MRKETIKINGMSCRHCVKSVEDELVKLPLKYFTVSVGSVVVEYDESLTGTDAIKQAIEDAGYEAVEIIEAV